MKLIMIQSGKVFKLIAENPEGEFVISFFNGRVEMKKKSILLAQERGAELWNQKKNGSLVRVL